jgi:hypothetical protein
VVAGSRYVAQQQEHARLSAKSKAKFKGENRDFFLNMAEKEMYKMSPSWHHLMNCLSTQKLTYLDAINIDMLEIESWTVEDLLSLVVHLCKKG